MTGGRRSHRWADRIRRPPLDASPAATMTGAPWRSPAAVWQLDHHQLILAWNWDLGGTAALDRGSFDGFLQRPLVSAPRQQFAAISLHRTTQPNEHRRQPHPTG